MIIACVLAVGSSAADRPAAAKTAGLSDPEIAVLKEKISKLGFPVPDFTVEDLLPVLVESHGVAYAAYADGGEKDDSGWTGGMIADFWLNDDFVIRMTYAY